ncbi:MAG: Coenzyme F420 hydrogenase/dehydrogenase, beta subunit C-terminal domain [Syntrophales bacterium]|nr:Coenzyme F420 hydrogenase/dehydrogenase, beta subunit C-terminal domain [Syntrophales bacterium]
MEDRRMGQRELQQGVIDTHLCTGCGACVGLCPYQTLYNDGIILLHPCDIKVGRCYMFCPRTPTEIPTIRKSLYEERDLTPEIGAVKGFYITRATDEQVRKGAQHGGTVTTLMMLALQEGIIDTAVIAEGEENFLHQGIAVNDPSEVKRRGKSKFIISPTVAEFNRVAKGKAEKIGVVATPCQVLALAKMRLKPIPTDDSNIGKLKLVVGLFCGWALSWRGFVDLLRKKTDLDAIIGMDIPPRKHTLEVYTKGGTIEFSIEEVNSCIRGACHYCFDTTAEFSDISVGSARLPGGWEETRTWNQVIVRTQRGDDLVQLARARGLLEFREAPRGSLDELKRAAMEKKRTALKNIVGKSGSSHDLVYLDRCDPVVRMLQG